MLHAGLCAWSAAAHSGAADELGAHVASGWLYWTSGTWSGGLGNFPLGPLLVAAPVALSGQRYALWTEEHLLLFRLPVVALSVLTAALVWRLARRLGGPLAGLGALALAAGSPNLVAHGSLATLDLPVTAFATGTVAAVAAALAAQREGRLGAGFVGLAALALGGALLTKVQALLLLPLLALILPASGALRRRSAWTWILLLLVPWLMAHLVYREWPLASGGLLPEAWAAALGEKWRHAERGHFSYFLGSYDSEGRVAYFPVLLLLKMPLVALLALAAGLARRPSREEALLAWLPAAALLALAMASRVNIGLRHVLPVLPFLFVMGGCGLAQLARRWRHALALAAGLHLVNALVTAPHAFAFYNLLAGGSARGHRVAVQSNYDWGLHDRQLAAFVAASGERWQVDPDPFRPGAGDVIVGANALYGIINGGEEAYAWLDGVAPEERVAWTWFVYRLEGEPTPRQDREARRAIQRHVALLAQEAATFDDPGLQRDVARAFVDAGAYGSGLAVLRAVLDRHPDDARALAQGGETLVRWKLGVLRFDEDPDEPVPAYLRPLLAPEGVPPTGEALVRAAQETGLAADLAQAWDRLGRRRKEQGEAAAAVAAWRVALLLAPDEEAVLTRLAWCLATCRDDRVRDGAAALDLVERWAATKGWSHVGVRDILAAALAEEGRYAEAEAEARAAAEAARADGDTRRAAKIQKRVEAYARWEAWRE